MRHAEHDLPPVGRPATDHQLNHSALSPVRTPPLPLFGTVETSCRGAEFPDARLIACPRRRHVAQEPDPFGVRRQGPPGYARGRGLTDPELGHMIHPAERVSVAAWHVHDSATGPPHVEQFAKESRDPRLGAVFRGARPCPTRFAQPLSSFECRAWIRPPTRWPAPTALSTGLARPNRYLSVTFPARDTRCPGAWPV